MTADKRHEPSNRPGKKAVQKIYTALKIAVIVYLYAGWVFIFFRGKSYFVPADYPLITAFLFNNRFMKSISL